MLIEMRDIFTVVLIVVNNRNWFHPFDAKSNMPTYRISRERRALCIMILPVFHFVTLFMWVLMMMLLLRYMELSESNWGFKQWNSWNSPSIFMHALLWKRRNRHKKREMLLIQVIFLCLTACLFSLDFNKSIREKAHM